MTKIGVLGGIGPEASAAFYRLLVSRLQERGLIRTNADFPQIIINSIPAPELVGGTISEHDLLPYIRGLKELDRHQPDFIVMVCNTIHLFFDRLQKEIRAPLLDLRRAVQNEVRRRGISTALIIGTPHTVKEGLYRFPGCMEPTDAELRILSDAIFNFNAGKNKPAQIQTMNAFCRRYLDKGAQAVILGCTEFAVMLSEAPFPIIDTIDVLVDATIERFLLFKTSAVRATLRAFWQAKPT